MVGGGGLRERFKAEEAELRALWGKRPELGEAGWARLWELISLGLKRCRPAQLGKFSDDFDDLVSDFFISKVFEPRRFHSGAPEHFGALCVYFGRFLLDRLPSGTHVSLDEERDGNLDDDESAGCGCAIETHESMPGGIDGDAMLASAHGFYTGLPEWAQLYLGRSICPDDDNEPLYKLAERMGIASHHYKAQQLGVTRAKGDSWRGYEKTLIGAWIQKDLHCPIDPEHQDTIHAAIALLCLVAMGGGAPKAAARRTPNA